MIAATASRELLLPASRLQSDGQSGLLPVLAFGWPSTEHNGGYRRVAQMRKRMRDDGLSFAEATGQAWKPRVAFACMMLSLALLVLEPIWAIWTWYRDGAVAWSVAYPLALWILFAAVGLGFERLAVRCPSCRGRPVLTDELSRKLALTGKCPLCGYVWTPVGITSHTSGSCVGDPFRRS